MKKFSASLLFALLAFVQAATAADLPRARPEAVGLSSERLDAITEKLKADIAAKKIPGAVLLVARQGKVAYLEAMGERDPQRKVPMTTDSIFRIYSMSKPITTVAAMMLVENGKMSPDDPIAAYMPQFAKMNVGVEKTNAAGQKVLELEPARRPITVQDLMRHTSGLTYGFFGEGMVKKLYTETDLTSASFTNAEFVDRLAKLPLVYQPGSTWDYSYSTDVLGRLVEVVSGKSLYQFANDNILSPLGMTDTGFYATPAGRDRVAEPFDNDRVIGVNAEFGDPRKAQPWESGGGGMIGTAMDYARFAQMLLNGGTLDGKRILGPRTLAYMTANHSAAPVTPGPYYLPGIGYGFGLGFAVRTAAGMAGYEGSEGDYYWGGAGGTYFWVDPKQDMFVVFMMQSPKQRVYYRSLLRNMVYAAITK